MAFGPELVWVWKCALSSFTGRRVQRAEGANSALALSFGTSEIFISWASARCGVCVISQKERKNLFSSSESIPPITNALKSRIIGAELTDVQQIARDKILKLSFKKSIGAGFPFICHIIAEVMERYANVVLVDADENIIEAAKHFHTYDNTFRTILPGLPYHLPPRYNGISLEEWLAAPDAAKLSSVAGFGKKFLASLSGMPTEDAATILSSYYCDTNKSDFTAQSIGSYVTAAPLLLPSAKPLDEQETGKYLTLRSIGVASVEARKKRAAAVIQKEILRRERQTQDINDLINKNKSEIFKKYGELIVANLWRLNQNVSEARLTGYDTDGNEYEMNVPLDSSVSPKKNAENYFAKYKKLTAAADRAAQLLPKIESELNDLGEQLTLLSSISDAEDLSMVEEELGIAAPKRPQRNVHRKKEILPPHRRFEFDNAIVFVGLSAKGNRYVTFKTALPDDIWFHVQGVPGAHIILRISQQTSENEIERLKQFCASLAVFYSKAKGETNVRVDFTMKKYVTPIRGGIANVTYREFSTIYASSDYASAETNIKSH
ncbi:MAG: NFACT family protein [Synergistes sp.]|nr:NFACT family protein [Synergistes sp.]